MKVAFLGLGNMGSGIANNILRAGFDLTVWNRTQEKMQPLMDKGATGAKLPKEAVSEADVVFTSLMDDQSIRDNLEGENGMLAGMKPGSVHVCLTTISPKFADELAVIHGAHGSRFVAGPVLGRPDAAADGALMSFMAGDQEALEVVTPVCEAYTETLVPIGEKPGVAAALKLCMNYTAISIIEMMGEVYACAEKADIDLDLMKGIYESAFAHPALKMYAGKIRSRAFDDGGFRMTGGLKDVRLMLEAAESFGAQFEIGKIVERKMLTALEQGMADRDWSAIYEISRQQAGLA
jgi:3-hydroxyisobutyrate dehydrogenase-like beta-hydroxyacid dehydrogenase